MMRVLVTGASGFVGRSAVRALTARGIEVHAASRHAVDSDRDEARLARWHATDLLDERQARRLVRVVAPTHLLHLAWYVEHGRFWSSPENLRWLAASCALLDAFADARGERVVTVGTCAEYTWDDTPCDEERSSLRPRTLYGAAKRALGEMAERHAETAGHAAAHARLFHLYGPGEPAARLVASVLRACLAGREATVSDGAPLRDFLHVDDAGAALAALLLGSVRGPVNIGSGAPVALGDVAAGAARAAGRPDLLRLGARPTAPGDPARLVPTVRRLHDEVGWSPSIPLDVGLASYAAWCHAERE